MPTNSGLSTWPGSGRQQWRPHHCWLLGPSLLGVCLLVKWLCFSVGFLNALFCLLIPFLVLCLSPQIHTVFTYMQAFISVGYAISFNSKNLCIRIAPQACVKATFFFLLKKKMFIWKRDRASILWFTPWRNTAGQADARSSFLPGLSNILDYHPLNLPGALVGGLDQKGSSWIKNWYPQVMPCCRQVPTMSQQQPLNFGLWHKAESLVASKNARTLP